MAISKFKGIDLIDEIFSLPQLQIILALGTVSHGAVLTALGQKKSAYKFGHNKFHNIKDKIGKNIILANSYHCSRYNTNTGRLTESMFESVFEGILNRISWVNSLLKEIYKSSNY